MPSTSPTVEKGKWTCFWLDAWCRYMPLINCFLDVLLFLGTRRPFSMNAFSPLMGESLGKLIFREKPPTRN
ncbi:hypothetical protein EUGRSUZ_G00459 [Eucalyptus grandis]|uniref:Uncharacterized protein n=2 Tax=Eucalyptus grandis TaxID=71139 RepID=A0A059B9Z3_EUCGR|nr:hypothetical protein EUGRSUZ_G00459 [Eucalyptus grandis]